MISVSIVGRSDDLATIVAEINGATWDEGNEISAYDVESLAAYLDRQDTMFVTCHDLSSAPRTLLGIASARVELKPYGNERWLYIDEVDVRPDRRRMGAGTAIMRTLIDMAREHGCKLVWLGAESGNVPAMALYRSLGPDDVARFVGYTYETGV